MYINDLPEQVRSTTRLFADDCLLYSKINFLEDTIIIQDDLVKLQQWEDKWLLCFNPDECEVLKVTAKKKPLMSDYNIQGTILSVVPVAKYQGVSIDSRLSFNHHIDYVAKKSDSISIISRTTKLCPLLVRAEAYTTYVKPLWEYSSSVWNPHTQRNINKLEAVQRRAARAVLKDYDRTSSVTSMLQQLKWNTLLERRAKQLMAWWLFHLNPTSCLIYITQEDMRLSTTSQQPQR